MRHQKRKLGAYRDWVSIDGPLIWLAYLPLFFIPWYFEPPPQPQMIWGFVGIGVFLVLYFLGGSAKGLTLIALATTILLLSFALLFTQSNWTVIGVYAAAMIGNLRPAWRAGMFVGAFAAATAAIGLIAGQHPFYWGIGVFMIIMIGIATISRSVLEDKNRSLLKAQDEVKRLAATAERERIGRDLHDLLGRTLTLIAIKADLSVKLNAREPAKAEAEMREVAGAAREALAEVRAAVAGMTNATLGREIAGAQRALAAAGIACIVEGEVDQIDQGASAVLAMALREAVTNVIRHSGAKTCTIALKRRENAINLTISDDGDGAAIREGGGLGGIRARLAAAGGELAVSGDGSGARIVAQLPMETKP